MDESFSKLTVIFALGLKLLKKRVEINIFQTKI